jgi:hypothetical protein
MRINYNHFILKYQNTKMKTLNIKIHDRQTVAHFLRLQKFISYLACTRLFTISKDGKGALFYLYAEHGESYFGEHCRG